ncbi:MAG: large subunit ribosomal protein L18 [Lysobacterales bacterium]|jgi:large subunit ribosomal protein L18
MANKNVREVQRVYRHQRLRKKISGTADRPRLCVHRSSKNLSAQAIDDTTGTVLFGMTTLAKDITDTTKNGGNVAAASALGATFAKKSIEKGIKKVSFDRGGYLYHGRVKAFAEAAREAGMEF